MKMQWLGSAATLALVMSFAANGQENIDADAGRDRIVVLGEGQTRQTQTLDGAEALRETPGTSPIKLVDRLPGVSFTSADAHGSYEWAVRINIRGFNQNQLGFTLDGVPLGDMSYGNHNGLHISRATISENLERVELAQGSGALSVASSSNLGGTLQFISRDPSEDLGAFGQFTVGSDAFLRGYGRLETGAFGPLDTRAYVSYANLQSDKWKGDGEQNHEQASLRIVQPLGEAGEMKGWVNWSERRENDYQDLSLAMIDRLGYEWDNISDDWNLAVQIADIGNNRGDTGGAITNPGAGTVYPAPILTVDDAYFDAAGLRDDLLSALQHEFSPVDWLTFDTTLYNHQNEGQGIWFTPYVASPNATVAGATANNAPISVRTTEYDINRTGLISNVTADLGRLVLDAGFWYEDNAFEQYRRFYGLDRAAPQRDSLEFMTDPFFTQWGYAFETETWKFHAQGTLDVTDALTVNAGFKSLDVVNTVDTLVRNNAAPVAGSNTDLNGSIETEDNFLPQLGFTYDLEGDNEIFGGYSENIAAFVSAATSGPFASQSVAVVTEVNRTLKPESSRTYELGFRTRQLDGRFDGVIAGYLVDFENRILAVTQGAGIVGNAPILSNVGGVQTVGLEAAASFDVTDEVSLFGSYTFNQSEYEKDVVNLAGVTLARTGGKTVVNTPEQLAKAELTYDNDTLFGGLSVSHVGERFYTFENVGGVDAYTTVDLNLGYRFPALFKGVEAQLNVTNLLDEDYVTTVGTNGFTNSDPNGTFQTLQVAPPRQAFVTLRTEF